MLNFVFREEFSIFTFILCRKCKNSANLVGVDFPSKNLILQSSRIRRSIKCSFEEFSEYIILHNYRSELHGNDFIFFFQYLLLSFLSPFLSLSRGFSLRETFVFAERSYLLLLSVAQWHNFWWSPPHRRGNHKSSRCQQTKQQNKRVLNCPGVTILVRHHKQWQLKGKKYSNKQMI